jgi:hypothetical protein
MRSIQDGTVYISLDVDVFDEENTVPRWNGHCEFQDGSRPELGPEFLDAADAVTWWRERGATRIYIRLDFGKYQWAGEGSPPDDQVTIAVFDPSDPRGRLDGAAKTSEARRLVFEEAVSARRRAAALDEGRLLTRRREQVQLSVAELANRVGRSEQWLLDAESGISSSEMTFSQWVDLVWATRKGWPEEVRINKTNGVSWVGTRGQYLRGAEVFVNKLLGLYD